MEERQMYENDLDRDYISVTGKAIAAALRANQPIEVNYQPGDRTRYELVFVPIQDLVYAPARHAPIRGHEERPVAWDARCSFAVARHAGAALVAWKNHGASAFDLATGGYHPSYIAGTFGGGAGNCEALAALFEAVTGEFS